MTTADGNNETTRRPAQSSKTPKAASTPREANAVSVALGQSLKALRIARDLSQEQLAGEAEVDRTLLSRIERGVSNPSLLTLSVICYCLKITLSELLEPVKKNVKPSWVDPKTPVRRKNGATPPRVARKSRLR
ncbi:helix-turn-helix transcriptional regulator [Variovorax atrisoli]|uniref:helix-turn-helix transcriptional regulator n=1 Tax=Variovorax atrisoli TaxID=3394203 RepID=UPI0009B7CB92|nr:helix-turn-helix domain-containing protein [Variovorax paradoxus]